MLSRSLASPFRGAGGRIWARRVGRIAIPRPFAAFHPSIPRRPYSGSAPAARGGTFRKVSPNKSKFSPNKSKVSPHKEEQQSAEGSAQGTPKEGDTIVPLASLLDLRRTAGKPHLWLRDVCPCAQCVDPHSGQKSFATTQLNFVPLAKSVERHEHDGSLTVVWADDPLSGGQDHTSHYPAEMLKMHTKTFPARRLWNRRLFEERERDRCRVSYADWMAGDAKFWAAMAQLSSTGLIFVYDMPEGDEKAVERIGEQMGSLQETFYGRTWDVVSKPQAENVAYTNQFLGLHQDLLYYPDPPRIQFLHCLVNDAKGGESIFADGVYAAMILAYHRKASFEALLRNPTAYHYNRNGNAYYAERPVIKARVGMVGRLPLVENVWWSPPFQAPFPVDSADMAAWYLSSRQFQTEIERPEHTVEYRLRPGECVVFDNWRVLHGRKEFDPQSGGRHLKGTYVDDATYRGKLADMPEALQREHVVWKNLERENVVWRNPGTELSANLNIVRNPANLAVVKRGLSSWDQAAATWMVRAKEGTLSGKRDMRRLAALMRERHPSLYPLYPRKENVSEDE